MRPELSSPAQVCPTAHDKVKVLEDMIFPLVQKLGQTIIFVRTRETARALHGHVSLGGFAAPHYWKHAAL